MPAFARSSVTNYVEGEALVTFKPSTGLKAATWAMGRHRFEFKRHFQAISQMRGREFGLVRATNLTTAALLARLRQDPAVESAEPNYIARIAGVFSPNDTRFPELWGLQNTGQVVNGSSGTPGADVSFNTAWALAGVNTNEVVVAVLDTGTDYEHPELVDNLWTNTMEIPLNGVDDDGNGFADDVLGWNFADDNDHVSDSGKHGTRAAGTIAAAGNNLTGIIGVNPSAKIMTLKASSDGHNFQYSILIDGINYAVMMRQRGVNIVAICASVGGYGESESLRAAIQSAGDAGIIFCAAAGNGGDDQLGDDNEVIPFYPSSFHLSNMISVAASDQTDTLAVFSNYSSNTVDLAAPGVNILSTMPLSFLYSNVEIVVSYPVTLVVGTNSYPTTNFLYSPQGAVSATIYNCGVGRPYEFPPFMSGNIALMSRGVIPDTEKVTNARAVGAAAAIIYNDVPGSFTGSLGGIGDWIPTISLSQEDGQRLQTVLPAIGTESVIMVVTYITNGVFTPYEFFSGTSIAAAHVAGAVAFAAMNFPGEDFIQLKERVLTNVDVLPSLSGLVTTGGRLNLQRMVDTDSNGLPDWWELQYFSHLTATSPDADPDGDGAGNLAEWLAGTDPTDLLSRLWVSGENDGSGTQGLVVRWTSVDTRSYFVQRKYGLSAGTPFETIATNIAGQAGTTSYTDTSVADTNTTVIYRVGVP